MNEIEYSNHSVTYPDGFKVASIESGQKENRKDMALIVSTVPAECAIVTTTNKIKAAPVIWDQEITQHGTSKEAIIVNVGSANACTGELGYENARATAEMTAAELGCPVEDVLVSSTGVIGIQLEMDKISKAIPTLVKNLDSSEEAGKLAAEAILTTDTKIKTASAEFLLGDKTVRIGAMAKGSGMIRPNMATMLSFVTTDLNIKQSVLQEALSLITLDTYNMISVDGDMSTNDTAIILANGLAQNKQVTSLDSKDGKLVYQALFEIEKSLAVQIIKDGEGATKSLQAHVVGAKNKNEARILAKAVVESNLVKAAFFGEDANWGRIISALGSSGAECDEKKVKLDLKSKNGVLSMFDKGQPVEFDEDEALNILGADEIDIDIDMGLGDSEATAWGCDLSYDYVKINGEYRS